MAKFIHNKSTSNVVLLEGSIIIPVGQKVQVADSQASDPSVVHAAKVGWVTVEGVKSATPTPEPTAKPVPEVNPMEGSTTIPKKAKKEVEPVTSSALGTGTAAEITPAEVAGK